MSRPEEALQDPSPEDPLPSTASFILGGNFISPAYWVSTAVKNIWGFDVFSWAAQRMEGDWESVQKAAIAAGNLSRFNTAFAASVKSEWRPRRCWRRVW